MSKCYGCKKTVSYPKCTFTCPNENCGRKFHKACYRTYLVKNNLISCCSSGDKEAQTVTIAIHDSDENFCEPIERQDKNLTPEDNYPSIPITTNNLHISISNDLTMTNTTDLDNLVPPATPTPPKVPDDWNKWDADKKLEQIMLKVCNTETLILNTQTFLQELSTATNRNSIAIKDHETRITSNEKNVSKCNKKIKSLKSKSSTKPSSAILIDNIPKSLIKHLTDSPLDPAKSPLVTIFETLLEHMKVQNVSLTVDILEITEFLRKGPSQEQFCSIKVRFKSFEVRDYVLEKKRELGKIDIASFFSFLDKECVVFMNELLPSPIFKLHMEARRRKREMDWDGTIFIRSNHVFGKNNITKEIFSIIDEDDLSMIT